MSIKAEADEEYIRKLKGQRKGLSRNVLIWTMAFLIGFSFIVIGVLDYNADYKTVTGAGDKPIVTTIGIDNNGEPIETTLFPVFNFASYKKVNGGFLPDAINLTVHDWIMLAVILFLGIPSILIYEREGRRLAGIDNNLPFLLREIADSQRIGMHLPRAISEAAKRDYGPLSKELKKLAAKISWGIPFRDAMLAFRRAVDTPLARQATILILEAERSGGELEKIFDSAKDYVQELLEIKKDRESSIKPYIYIVFMSYVIFAIVIFVLFTTFFAPFGVEPIKDRDTNEDIIVVPLEAFKVAFLYMLATQAFFSGLVAGKMGKGKLKLGLFYSTIMLIIGLLIHKVFIIPRVEDIVRSADNSGG